MPTKHTVRSYDEELRRLANTLTQMGGLAESQLFDESGLVGRATQSLVVHPRQA